MKSLKSMRNSALFLLTAGAVLLTACGKKSTTVDYSKYVSLPDYSDLSVERVVMTVTDEDVQDEITTQLSYMAERSEITDRAAQSGDMVVIDFTGTVDGAEFEDGSAEDYELELGSDSFLDGFEEQIIGMKTGETKDITVTFPEPYDGELDGKEAVFSVTLKEIYELILPEYNAQYVASISDYSSTEEYEEGLRNELQESYDTDSLSTACENALYEIIGSSSFSGYPEDLYDECKAELESENQEFLDAFGVDDLSEIYGEEYDEEASILDKVHERMVVNTLASKEGLEITDDDYEAALQNDLDLYAEYDSLEDLKKNTDEDAYRYQLLRQKVLDFLGENVQFIEVSEEDYYDSSEDGDTMIVEDVEEEETETETEAETAASDETDAAAEKAVESGTETSDDDVEVIVMEDET